ncbi:MAG: DUF4368 domain-containing protein [Spirochaetes bacterium]|uniref:DUF4368 domain-containing protein n=1 Tax=Candidatus Gallitreponema excrementavium TaxID=2840840 RepID=A0A9D9N2T0_9SPIR|nr:DUF4368 domain-containing protein [Candidatus Gallitreponema excrementavium]
MIGVLKKDVQKQEKEQINIKSFIGIAKKYTDIQELDATILREFISKIYVSAYDRKSKTREIQIVYNFIGAFDFDRAKLNTKNKSNNTSNLGNEVKSPPPVKRVARDAGSKPALLGRASRRWLSLSCYGKFAAHPSHSSVQATLLLTRRCP